MHDGIELEKLGIPTAVICTDPFIPTAKAVAAISGIPAYPFVTIPSIARLGEDELRSSARVAATQVVELLLRT